MTANERDEVVLAIGDRTYTYVADMAALFRAERAMSDEEGRIVPSREILYGSMVGSNRHTRFLLWGALQRHHPDVTLEDATALLAKVGFSEGLVALLTKLRESTQPDKEDQSNSDRPPRARRSRGTGARASSSPDASGSTKSASGG